MEVHSMEIKVTLELHGASEQIGLLLAQLSEALLSGEHEAVTSEGRWWTMERAAAFVDGLTDPALQALDIIAANSPKISFAEFQSQMGVSGPGLAGRLSSIGFAVTRTGAPFPFFRDYYQRAYTMDEETATVFREAIAVERERRKGK
jgi:hypothetical protein